MSSLLVLSYEDFRELLDKMCRCDGMVDVADSKSADGDIVGVRVPPPAPLGMTGFLGFEGPGFFFAFGLFSPEFSPFIEWLGFLGRC